MEIKTTVYKVKCDVAGCKNHASYFIENKGFLLDRSIYLCENCIKEIYNWYSQKVTPKGISNMLNKKGIAEPTKKTRKKKGNN